ncbi:MAG: phosphoribosylglycinamide formyltransferase [Candidatus Kapabacteria bacterium]|jgi:phosphoribosylglycinamide formyltransferase-1|nr:phosphoribosylglycinamide formyltransferase [Candidatus Kapabacteria bacterium]
MKSFNIAFFASHGGSNMQALIDASKSGRLKSTPALVISNNSNSIVLERAVKEEIPNFHISSNTHPDDNVRTQYIIKLFELYKINLVVLAGYMKKLPDEVINKVNGRVLNIHPALLPKFGGEGMYGMKVHQAVLDAKETESGVTVHLVDSEYDRGRILLQRTVPVNIDDTPETLAARVLEIEHRIYPEVIEMIESGKIEFN